MENKIHALTPVDPSDLMGNGYTHFLRDLGFEVSMTWDTWEARLMISDIAFAGKSGKTCPIATVTFKHAQHYGSEGLQDLANFLKEHGNDLRAALAFITSLPWQPSQFHTPSITAGARTFHIQHKKAARVFSPFATFSPLKAAPEKWTITHVVRALWNNQFTGLKCTGRYTDDYKYDASRNFGKDDAVDARGLCEELITSPSGWWTSGVEDVSISCHHFKGFQFRLQLSAPALAA